MAASDPVPSVPTPTGALQGVAAFSWDGTTWQPAGGAYSSVATPTGVLRGVAPFSYSGGVWTPAGRAQPGVPTPTGTLDGVAVYTWSGSAWTPAGGNPDVPTPSGTLQGVAAFYFDGTNWQPTGQAAPEVATPSGVLMGVAMFSQSGGAWGPTVAPGTLDLNFVTMSVLDPSVTFTRASTATYFDATGTMQTAGNNVPRLDHNPVTRVPLGLLIEESRTNLLLNSATLGTQSVTTTATATTLSFYGTGSVTLSGTSSGTASGVGTTTRIVTTFTPTAGTLTLTVSGSVTNAQLEAGPFVTSYIPTAAATVTRATETATIATIPGRNGSAETFAAEFNLLAANAGQSPRIVGGNGQVYGFLTSWGGPGAVYDGAAVLTTSSIPLAVISKMASSWSSPNNAKICLNAGTVATATTLVQGFGAEPSVQFMGDGTPADAATGYIRRFRYWPRVLANAEMQQVTT